jgi:hypothetical protein
MASSVNSFDDRAADQLRASVAETKSVEVRRLLQAVLDHLDAATPETLRSLRAVKSSNRSPRRRRTIHSNLSPAVLPPPP